MRIRRGIVVTLGYGIVALLFSYPLWLHLTDSVPGDIGDPLLNSWTLAWVQHSLSSPAVRLFDANIFYPLPNTLAFSEHLAATALLVFPLGQIFPDPVILHNLSLLLSLPLAGLGMYLLAYRWTGRHSAAWIAGLAFAFAPYRLASISHLQLVTFHWLPLSVLALDLLLQPGESGRSRPAVIRRVVLLVIFTTLQILSSWYLAVFTCVILGIYVLAWLVLGNRAGNVRPANQEKRRMYPAGRGTGTTSGLWGLLAAGLLTIVLVIPFGLPYLKVMPQLRESRPVSQALDLAAQPGDYAAAAPFSRFWGPRTQMFRERPGFTEENTLFPGVLIAGLAVAGLAAGLFQIGTARRLREKKRTASQTADFRLAALAATLLISVLLTFPGPYRVLIGLFPPLQVVRVPARWMIPATFALAGLAAYGAGWLLDRPGARLARSWATAICLLISVGVVGESLAWPLPLATVGQVIGGAPVYRTIDSLMTRLPGARGAVVELPMYVAPAPEYPETKRMVASSAGWWGLVNGYSGFTPKRQQELNDRLTGFPDAVAMNALRELGTTGVRFLVVHPDERPMDRNRWDENDRWIAERNSTLIPLGTYGADELYWINPYGDDLLVSATNNKVPFLSPYLHLVEDTYFIPPESDIQLHLLAFVSYPDPAQIGRTRLHLYWRTDGHVPISYTVFVHSLDRSGTLVDQADGVPLEGHYGTLQWTAGEIIQDSRSIATGDKYLVGLYDRESAQRVPAFGPGGIPMTDNAVQLTP